MSQSMGMHHCASKMLSLVDAYALESPKYLLGSTGTVTSYHHLFFPYFYSMWLISHETFVDCGSFSCG